MLQGKGGDNWKIKYPDKNVNEHNTMLSDDVIPTELNNLKELFGLLSYLNFPQNGNYRVIFFSFLPPNNQWLRHPVRYQVLMADTISRDHRMNGQHHRWRSNTLAQSTSFHNSLGKKIKEKYNNQNLVTLVYNCSQTCFFIEKEDRLL